MKFRNNLNKISRIHNKVVMTSLSILILAMLVKESFSPSELDDLSRIVLLTAWCFFVFVSGCFTLNGLLMYSTFVNEISEMQRKGKPIRGIRGFTELTEAIRQSRNTSIIIFLVSIISLVIFVIGIYDIGLLSDSGRDLVATIGITMAFITLSIVFMVEYPESISTSPGDLVGFYEPDVFPMLIDNLLSDVFKTYLDPFSFIAFDEWTKDIQNRLAEDFESQLNEEQRVERAREKTLLIAYLSNSAPELMPFETAKLELVELFGNNIQDFLAGKNSGLSWDEILKMMNVISKECPEALRIVDRLMEELLENYESFTSQGCYFTVSARTNQGSILESSGAFVFLLNNLNTNDEVFCVEFRSDRNSIQPHYQKININLDANDITYPENRPQVVSEGEDILSLLDKILQIGDAVWFRFKSSGFGFKVVTFQAENTNTVDIHGSSFEIRFTKSINWYVKTYAPKISALGGVILPILQASLLA